MQQFKIRCSQIGQIMAIKGLGKTGESYLDSWIKEQLFFRRKEFESKYTNKGNQVEAQSIDFIADQLGYGMLLKNEQHYENHYLTGTPDIVLNDTIIDAKNSWDCFTFPLFETKINDDYFYQGQGYLALTDKENYKLIYCLTDTPEDLIIREAQSYCYKNNIELDDEILNKFIKKMTYKDIPDHLKIKVYEFKRDEAVIQSIYERVELCRDYISKKLESIKDLF